MDNPVNYSTILKNKYGDNFLLNHLRSRGAPTSIRTGNQLYGILTELLNYIRSQNDTGNTAIISYIDNISTLRNENDRAKAIELLEHLGLNNRMPVVTTITQSAFTRTSPSLRFGEREEREAIEDNDNREKVSYLTTIPTDTECPICLDNITGSGYSTDKCHSFFHKQCLDRHCSDKRSCPCPICRRKLKFVNTGDITGGIKKRHTKKSISMKKRRTKRRKSKVSRKR
jgi:hypothetical protein